MENKFVSEFLGDGEILDCNCHDGDSDLMQTTDGKWQVACDGCGMRGPAGTKQSAVHEWNLITMAAASSFSAAQIISLDCIERCRQQGKPELEPRFVENLHLSMQGSERAKSELLQNMGLAQ